MGLEELKKRLYEPDEDLSKEPKVSIYQPDQFGKREQAEDWSIQEKKMPPQKKKKLLIISSSLAVVFLIAAGFLIWRGLTSFDKSKVRLEISGPERIISGDEASYTVKCQNNTRLELKNIRLTFYYPDKSIPMESDDLVQVINLPDLAPGAEKKIDLSVRIIGLKGENKEARAELSFQPANLSSSFNNQASFSTNIISVPLIIDFDLPEKLVDGQSFKFSLRYLNQAEVSFDDIEARIDYPQGFVFQSAQPQPSQGENIWQLGNLMAGEEGKIFVQGIIQGSQDESKTFKGELGTTDNGKFVSYAEAVDAAQISVSPLYLTQTVNGSADYIAIAGEKLNFLLNYKNTANVGITEAIITVRLEGKALNLSSLELGNGSLTSEGQALTIVWNAANLPLLSYLAPNQSGQIIFSIRLKDNLLASGYSDKNFKITSVAAIDSVNVPLSLENIQLGTQNTLVIKVSSQLTLRSKGYYYDDLIPNHGPIPPKVGQQTTYTIKWQLINSSDDLDGMKVVGYLPPHAQWLNTVKPGEAKVSYNSQTGQVIWTIGSLPAGTGALLPVKEAAFQIGITPTSANVGNLMELIGQSIATGYDSFIGSELKSVAPAIDTNLPDDPAIDWKKGTVVE